MDSYDYQRFLSDYRDLIQWINGMNQLVSCDELANDVTGADAYWNAIRTIVRKSMRVLPPSKLLNNFGNQLINKRHYASEDVAQRQRDVTDARSNWKKRG